MYSKEANNGTPIERYISPEERQKIIDELRLTNQERLIILIVILDLKLQC